MAEELAVLVNRCLAGNQASFGELVARFRGQVYGLCYRMLGQREDAEDATQETFVRVVRNLHRWDQARAFEPWLLTIAGNRCRTRLSKRMRRPGSVTLEHPIADSWHQHHEAGHLAEEMNHVLASIRPEYRDAFNFFHQKEMCYEEISNEMQVPLGTVKTWVHRARRELICKLRQRGALSE
ncbi:MAG: sigma-70 family RNA polymerase sigma factor [Planctomycetota bacterium]